MPASSASTWAWTAPITLGCGCTTPYRDRGAILFDDTARHEAWNRGPADRVTLFLEVLRPASGTTDLLNHLTQRLLALDRRYRCAPAKADEWNAALNL